MIPPSWTFDPGDDGDDSVGLAPVAPHIWAPAPNGDVVELCVLKPCRYRENGYQFNEDEYDDGIRELCSPDEIGHLMAAAPDLQKALDDLLKVIAADELIPESVSYMRQARAVLAKSQGKEVPAS